MTEIRAATLAMVAAGFLAGCQKPPAPAVKPPRPVLSLVVSPTAASDLVLAGTVEARTQTGFGFRVLGRMISRPVNVGDLVDKGQTLATIDPVALKLAVQAARADLTNNEAQFENAAGVEERQAGLLKTNETTQAIYDAAVLTKASAQAGVLRAQSALAKAQNELGYSVLTSDFAGVVTSVGAEVGQTVSPGQTIAEVAQPDKRDAVIDVPDAIMNAVGIGARFKISLQLDAAIQAQGKVREIAPESDAATRTRRVKIAIDNPPDTFRLGSTIAASLASTDAALFVRLPASALLERDGHAQVWIVDPKSSTVSLREVKIEREGDEFVDVVSGLEPEMRVVTAGVHSLVDGQAVKISGDMEP